MNATKHRPRGPWINRFATWFFGIILGVLIFWLLGFVVQDIKAIKGPSRQEIEKKHVDQSLLAKVETLARQIAGVERRIKNKREEQSIVRERSENHSS